MSTFLKYDAIFLARLLTVVILLCDRQLKDQNLTADENYALSAVFAQLSDRLRANQLSMDDQLIVQLFVNFYTRFIE